jgi:protein TonB
MRMEAKKNPSADIHLKRPLLFSFSMILSLSMTIAALEWKTEVESKPLVQADTYAPSGEILEIPSTEQPPPPVKRLQQPQLIEVTHPEKIIEEITPIIDQEIIAETTLETVSVLTEKEEVEIGDEIFMIVESPAEFIGGQDAMNKFIVENIRYPHRAFKMGIQGKVFVKAVIEKDGSVSNSEILKGISLELDQEALRVINMMPRWNPGKQRGIPVRTSVVIPLVFKSMQRS